MEQRRPSATRGKSTRSPEWEAVQTEIIEHYHESDWHNSDEKNFVDTKIQAKRVIGLLNTLPHKHIAVVSHGRFLRYLVGLIMLEDHFSSYTHEQFLMHTVLGNTGMTICEQDNTGRWRLVTWNDQAHLAE